MVSPYALGLAVNLLCMNGLYKWLVCRGLRARDCGEGEGIVERVRGLWMGMVF